MVAMDLATIRARHSAVEMQTARAALEASDWMITQAASLLGCPISTLRRLIDRHPELSREYTERSPGRGRPRKTA